MNFFEFLIFVYLYTNSLSLWLLHKGDSKIDEAIEIVGHPCTHTTTVMSCVIHVMILEYNINHEMEQWQQPLVFGVSGNW